MSAPFLDFSVPLPAAPRRIVTDPILAAIERHRTAWKVFQTAPDGEPSLTAEDECDASRTALLGSPCTTRRGCLTLLDHLRWWLTEEAPNADAYGGDWQVAQARQADLALLLSEQRAVAA